MTAEQPATGTPKPRIRLPFDNRKQDVGEWAYDHRAGLCITLIVYLLLAVFFVASKIVLGSRPAEQGIFIDLKTLAELEAERDRLEREVRMRQEQDPIDWGSVSNRISNDNALNEELRDDRGTRTAELNASARGVEERMRANREAYERGLAEAAPAEGEASGAESASQRQDVRVKGTVTVRFDFRDPVRTERRLEIPTYLCQGGGEVVVSATVNRRGEVVGAKVLSGGDECMRETALRAARASLFNIDPQAPARQTGTITYLFVPQ